MKTIFLAAAVTLATAVSSGASTLTDVFTGFYSFGDSLSDDGKLNGVIPFAPPSLNGRFSNGPVWTEILASQFTAAGSQSVNLAIGGAQAIGPDLGAAAGASRLFTLQGQIGQFADIGTLGGIASGSNPLVSVWMGANDLFAILDPLVATAFGAIDAANAVEAGIRSIATLGSQFDSFLVVNMPDLGRAPAFSTLLGDPLGLGAASSAATALTNAFNAQLALDVQNLRDDGFEITTFDANALFDTVLGGSLEGDLAAFAGMDLRNPCTVSLTDPRFASCADPDQTLFVDGVHPNRIAHVVIADRVAAAVAPAPVPLPAGAPLLALGLAALGLAARRRAA